MGKGYNVTFDKNGVKTRIQQASNRAMSIMTEEFIKDANYYCPKDSGELQKSAIRASIPEKGLAIWDTPYAKRQYYVGKKNKSENPNASKMWAHKAHQEKREKYQRMAQKVIKEDV